MHSNTILMCALGQAAIDEWGSNSQTLAPRPTVVLAHEALEDLPWEWKLVIRRRQVRPACSAWGT